MSNRCDQGLRELMTLYKCCHDLWRALSHFHALAIESSSEIRIGGSHLQTKFRTKSFLSFVSLHE